jgi:hypothetical protein
MAVESVAATEVVQFGVLDWEACDTRFGMRPSSDVYFNVEKFLNQVPWYLAQGVYTMYLTVVLPDVSQIGRCERVWELQGNNFDGLKVYPKERSFSMGDIVVLSNQTIWVCVGSGWRCINTGVI